MKLTICMLSKLLEKLIRTNQNENIKCLAGDGKNNDSSGDDTGNTNSKLHVHESLASPYV